MNDRPKEICSPGKQRRDRESASVPTGTKRRANGAGTIFGENGKNQGIGRGCFTVALFYARKEVPMQKIDRTVVRNQAYRKQGISIRERHNERKNTHYCNPDIVQERSNLNIHFKRCEGTYAQAFDKMVADGTISTRGLKPDAKVMDEMVFDVNTAYFDRHGGYEHISQG